MEVGVTASMCAAWVSVHGWWGWVCCMGNFSSNVFAVGGGLWICCLFLFCVRSVFLIIYQAVHITYFNNKSQSVQINQQLPCHLS